MSCFYFQLRQKPKKNFGSSSNLHTHAESNPNIEVNMLKMSAKFQTYKHKSKDKAIQREYDIKSEKKGRVIRVPDLQVNMFISILDKLQARRNVDFNPTVRNRRVAYYVK